MVTSSWLDLNTLQSCVMTPVDELLVFQGLCPRCIRYSLNRHISCDRLLFSGCSICEHIYVTRDVERKTNE